MEKIEARIRLAEIGATLSEGEHKIKESEATMASDDYPTIQADRTLRSLKNSCGTYGNNSRGCPLK